MELEEVEWTWQCGFKSKLLPFTSCVASDEMLITSKPEFPAPHSADNTSNNVQGSLRFQMHKTGNKGGLSHCYHFYDYLG